MSKTFSDFMPDPSTVLSLEPEELAGVVLEYLNSLGEDSRGQFNRYNFSLRVQEAVAKLPRDQKEKIPQAFMEAWVWLEREGLLAPEPGQQGEWVFVTRRGRQLTSASDLTAYRRASTYPRQLLHPVIAQRTFPAFIRGDYDSAVFQAFREVEIKVRESGRFPSEKLGVSLMREALDPDIGVLRDPDAPSGERQAVSDLFAGAVGAFKNPQSHRNVGIIDPAEAVELIGLASHLMRILDSRVNSGGGEGRSL